VGVQTAWAHTDPPGAAAIGINLSLAAFRADGVTPVFPLSDEVTQCETIIYQATVAWAGGMNASFFGGTITIFTPDGPDADSVPDPHDVTPVGGIPCLGDPGDSTGEGCDGTPGFIKSQQVSFTADVADCAAMPFLEATVLYEGGTAHLGANNTPAGSASTFLSNPVVCCVQDGDFCNGVEFCDPNKAGQFCAGGAVCDSNNTGGDGITHTGTCANGVPLAEFQEVSRHGISADTYQDTFDSIVDCGLRPVFVDGYDVGGQTFFNATFRPAGPASVARHGLTGTEYQDLFDELIEDGFRLHQVDSYLDGGQVRYAAIFEVRSGPNFAAFHGFDDAEYDDTVDNLADDGYVPVNVSTVVAGQRFWTALFEQVTATGWTVESVPVADYQATFDANVAAGRIPIYVHGFTAAGGPHLTGIWVDPVGGSTMAVHGLSSDDYQDAFDSNIAAGRFTRYTTGYDDGAGNARFAAVWRGRPNTLLNQAPPLITNQTTATFGFAADNPFTTFQCRLDVAPFGACSSPSMLTSLSEGYHTYSVRAVDRELILDLSPASHTWLVDVTPPVIDIVAPAVNTKTVNGEPKDDEVEITTVIGWADVVADVTDNLSGVATVQFKVDGIPVAGVMVDVDTWKFTFEPDQNGEHIYLVEVVATDNAANSNTASIQILGVKTNKPN
jgi:hypothetical protein